MIIIVIGGSTFLRHKYVALILALNIPCGIVLRLLAQIPAFPGAEGYGSTTVGGRGGRVIKVTNTNNSGTGSLRAACTASGPRIVVFETGGHIILNSDININNPYITIAGQTAPGGGICIRNAALRVKTHDAIIRGLRMRVGDDPSGKSPGNRDSFAVENSDDEPYNVIVDHCSMSWSVDEIISLWYPMHDVTVQWSIISEALWYSIYPDGAHSRGFLIGDHSQNISVHHNLFAHNNKRSPCIKGNVSTEIVNNLIYNWGEMGIHLHDYYNVGPIYSNIIGNYGIPGPSTSSWFSESHLVYFRDPIAPGTLVYVEGNKDAYRVNDEENEWLCVAGPAFLPEYKSNSFVLPPSGITAVSAEKARDLVLQNAGATRPIRDIVDERLVNDVLCGTGNLVDCVVNCDERDLQVPEGDWPLYAAGTAPTDTDDDGMPDDWETSKGLNPGVYDANERDLDPDYDNVEVYVNSLIPDPFSKFMLKVNKAGSGSVSLNPSEGIYDEGTVVMLTANPDPGWSFDHWSGYLSGSKNPETVLMDSPKFITANFIVEGGEAVDLTPTDDAYVQGSIYASRNFNSSSYLRVRHGNDEKFYSNVYLKFDLSGIKDPIFNAVLKLTVKNKGLKYGSPARADIYSIKDDNWSESTITWNNAPPADVHLDSVNDIASEGKVYHWDVTSFIASEIVGDKVASLMLKNNDTADKQADFYSRETTFPPVLKVVQTATNHVEFKKEEIHILKNYQLCQNYPNPFNSSTRICYHLPRSGKVKLIIYDVSGREISVLVNCMQDAGTHDIIWEIECNKFASGIYLCCLQVNSFAKTMKMLLLQ